MNHRTVISLTLALLCMTAVPALAGGKADGTSCRSDKSCQSGLCEKAPLARTGTCCVRDTCNSLGAECGIWSDGCARQIDCGGCDVGYSCNAGTCEAPTACGWELNPYLPAGSYNETCSDCFVDGCTLGCWCDPIVDERVYSELDLGSCSPATSDIANIDGTLTCLPIE